MAIIGLAGAIGINRVMVVSIEATKARQTKTALAISSVHQRTSQWPLSDKDAMLTDEDRLRVRQANATFRLQRVDVRAHRAFYVVTFGDHSFRLNVPDEIGKR